MSTREQIEADAAMARRLQEEEFGHPRAHPTLRFPTHPYSRGSPTTTPTEMLTDIFRRAGAGNTPSTIPSAFDGMQDFAPFPGHQHMPNQRMPDQRSPQRQRSRGSSNSGNSNRNFNLNNNDDGPGNWDPNPDLVTPESLMRQFFGGWPQPGEDAPDVRSGAFVFGPNGLTRVDFQRSTRRSSSDGRSNDGRSGSSAQSEPRRHPGASRSPSHPQRRQSRAHDVHQHHLHQRGANAPENDPFNHIGDMLNEVFDFLGPLNGERGGAQRMGPGMTSIADWLRNTFPGAMAMGEPTTYEEWLQLIERMGGNVNRGATEEEISELPSEKFDKEMIERTRAKRRMKENRGARGSSSRAGSSTATEEAEKCAVCLGEYEEGEEVKTLPCFHVFHTECVDRWLHINKACPICKRSIRPGDGPAA